ncbi:hypothetical protein C8R43DRAFT_1117007 [Mycena crocata]|nr:hypothetical protein C8R43DRAFT_1117007 [Mycena crocata]
MPPDLLFGTIAIAFTSRVEGDGSGWKKQRGMGKASAQRPPTLETQRLVTEKTIIDTAAAALQLYGTLEGMQRRAKLEWACIRT